MMTNQKLQAGSVLVNVLGPHGGARGANGLWVCRGPFIKAGCDTLGDVLDSEVESINRQQRLPSASVYDSRKRDKDRSRYRIVIFQFQAWHLMLKWVERVDKIAALWKRKHFVTSSQATHFLPLVEPVSVYVHTFKQYWLMWLLTLYVMVFEWKWWGCLHLWFKVNINYQLIYGSIL